MPKRAREQDGSQADLFGKVLPAPGPAPTQPPGTLLLRGSDLVERDPRQLTMTELEDAIRWLTERRGEFVQQRKARKAGLASGRRRKANAHDPAEIRAAYQRHGDQLEKQGLSRRGAATLAAAELKVSSRHVRRVAGSAFQSQ